ncbi:MAG: Fe-S protein assembly co-chaperone HscB [Burkholderiaceae bacterium]
MQALKRNYFEFFSLPQAFGIDLHALELAYRQVQSAVHPDRFANAGSAEKRYAMQLATLANEAHQALRNPLTRARYLCEINGEEIGAEDNTAMPAEFMMQQLEWREALEEAVDADDLAAVDLLSKQVDAVRLKLTDELSTALDKSADFALAAGLVRRWMFLDRFAQEVNTATRSLNRR